jgi:hypothetical protein
MLVGCSRSLPDPTPGSAIDAASAAPKPIAVDVALHGHPPLPGESRTGWAGLAEPKPSGAHHDHHGHHAKPSKPAEPTEPAEPAHGGEHDH